jgi:hypothetical protein
MKSTRREHRTARKSGDHTIDEKRPLKGARGRTFSAGRGLEGCSSKFILGGVPWLILILTSMLTSIRAGFSVLAGF